MDLGSYGTRAVGRDCSLRLTPVMKDGDAAYTNTRETPPTGIEDEGRYRLHSKEPKRVVAWVSKAWTDYER